MAKKHAKRFRGHQDFKIGQEVAMSYLETFVNHMFCEEKHMCDENCATVEEEHSGLMFNRKKCKILFQRGKLTFGRFLPP